MSRPRRKESSSTTEEIPEEESTSNQLKKYSLSGIFSQPTLLHLSATLV